MPIALRKDPVATYLSPVRTVHSPGQLGIPSRGTSRLHLTGLLSPVLAGMLSVVLAGPGAMPPARADSQPSPSPTGPKIDGLTNSGPTNSGPSPSDSVTGGTQATVRFPLVRGDHGYLVAMAQRRLTWLGARISESELQSARFGPSTRKAVSAFQSKFFGSQHGRIGTVTWKALARISGRVWDLPRACTEQTSLCVDMSQRVLRYVVDGRVVLTLDARFGMPSHPTGRGTFTVRAKSRNHVSSKYHTWMPFAMFFNGGEAVHYSPYFDRDGYRGGSHGCVNLRDIARAEWLFDRIPIGTRVHVYA